MVWASGGVAEMLAAVSREVALPSGEGFGEAVNRLALQLEMLRAASQGQATAVGDNTAAVIQNTVAHATSGAGSAASSVGRAARSALGSGLVLSPLITGLARLFGAGKTEAPPPLVTQTRPPSIHLEGAVIRAASRETAVVERVREPSAGAVAERVEMTRPVNVTVQVQAMDSRSFLDHSGEIARAVREAMLHSHALNDIVSEL
ncbi:MAG: hypothetical protein AAB225_17415 [Acidobacteriota bacterium]